MTGNAALNRARELENLAHVLLEQAQRLRAEATVAGQPPVAWPRNVGNLGTTAEALLASRRQRQRYLDSALLGEPAWDMLLFLFAAFDAGAEATVGQVCQASGTFASTARRWLALLDDMALVTIGENPHSGRRDAVRLTDIGQIKMTKTLLGLLDDGIAPDGMAQLR